MEFGILYNTCVDKFRKNYEKIAEIIVRKGIWFQLIFVLFVLFGITAMDVPNFILAVPYAVNRRKKVNKNDT